MGLRAILVAIAISLLALPVTPARAARSKAVAPEAVGPIRPAVPEALKPWVSWVLHKQETALCPTHYTGADTRRCHWPSRLDVKATRGGAAFSQSGTTFAPGWISIPGDTERWPYEVKLDGKPAVVVARGERPSVFVGTGAYRVAGSLRWDTLPESLAVPDDAGLVTLAVNGRTMGEPNVDQEGHLWFQRAESADEETEGGDEAVERELGSTEDVRVYRLILDEIPLELQTRIELKVSGPDRKLVLGPVLPWRFVPLAVDSELPARLESDGRLTVQAKAGRWAITVRSRHEGPAEALSLGKATALWPQEEAWAFEARPSLRVVTVEGVPALDPQQTTLPDAWKKLPAYRMAPGTTMKLVPRGRGVDEAARDELRLSRQLWLDFDGRGYSIRDDLSGTMKRGWRLEMQPPMELGRAGVRGDNQLITKGESSSLPGLEIRETALQVDADSRLPRDGTKIPVGWNHDFQTVSTVVNLPPGWKAWAATGVDVAYGTWMSRWNLASLFLVLLVALSLAKLKGTRFALFGAAVLALTVPEHQSPHWLWVAVLLTLTLAKVLPEGRLKALARGARAVTFLILTVVVAIFAYGQVRTAIYPALEKPYAGISAHEPAVARGAVMNMKVKRGRGVKMKAQEMEIEAEKDDGVDLADMQEEAGSFGGAPPAAAMEAAPSDSVGQNALAPKPMRPREKRKSFSKLSSNSYQSQQVQQLDPNAAVQVGRGLPRWQWNRVTLGWSGPVTKSESLRLFLMPPWLAGPLAILNALLVALLGLMLAGEAWGSDPRKWFPSPRRAPATRALLFALLAGAAGQAGVAHAADVVPPKEILDELRTRLMEPPTCYPACASASRTKLEYTPQALTVRVELQAAVDTAVPIPGVAKQWLPTLVTIDGHPADGLARDDSGGLWLFLKKGNHQVLLSGRLADRDTVQLPLRLPAHNVSASGSGWAVEGIHKDGQAEETLELRRSRGRGAAARVSRTAALEATQLPPFVVVERNLVLGLTWNVRTRIARHSPEGSAIVLSVPLLAGESVTTPGVRTEKGRVLVNLAAREDESTWDSILEPKSPVVLTAPKEVAWTEVWRLDASALWTVAFNGIPRVVDADESGRKVPVWRPWPGEKLSVDITRPKAAEGQTLSLTSSFLDVRPGSRLSDATLSFELVSSRGGEHSIRLPESAELQSVTVGGEVQPLRADKGKLALPVAPGSRKFSVTWREPNGLGFWYRTPSVDLGVAGTNASVEVRLPEQRWVLWVGGPTMGPAVLLWGEILVILFAAYLLGRYRGTPLRMREWALLGIGLTQIDLFGKLILVAFFLSLGWRREFGEKLERLRFNLLQIALGVLAIVTLCCLFAVLQNGFFGDPAMHVAGNLSGTSQLRWFADLSPGALPRATVISAPLWCYRVAMLLWALWLAMAVIRWAKWAWECYAEGGIWKRREVLKGAR